MLLAIDIGNSRVKLGVYDNDKETLVITRTLPNTKNVDEMKEIFVNAFLSIRGINEAIFCSVSPEVNIVLKEACEFVYDIKIKKVTTNLDWGFNLDRNKDIFGQDRIAAISGVVAKDLLPCVIFDLGTAINVEVVNEQKNYEGGLIIPGVGKSLNSLIGSASLLDNMKLKKEEQLLTKETVPQINAGITHGYGAMVDGLFNRINPNYNLIITGGDACAVEVNSNHTYVENLTLEGLVYIHKLNK